MPPYMHYETVQEEITSNGLHSRFTRRNRKCVKVYTKSGVCVGHPSPKALTPNTGRRKCEGMEGRVEESDRRQCLRAKVS
jgi:hypothetical protein